jgi:hypothetical protein
MLKTPGDVGPGFLSWSLILGRRTARVSSGDAVPQTVSFETGRLGLVGGWGAERLA